MKATGAELPLAVLGAAIQVDAVGGAGDVMNVEEIVRAAGVN